MRTKLAVILVLTLSFTGLFAQKNAAPYGSGLKVSLNEDGSKYFRLITWHQAWLQADANNPTMITPSLRRSRYLMFAQINDRFLILTHFGLNSLSPAKMDPTGQSSGAQLFMHDAWGEWKVNDHLYVGSGLHYWNGISRLNNQSTLNFLPLDNARHAWATIGTSDQFARHMGVYAKGKFGKLDYRFAWNSPIVNSIDANAGLAPTTDKAVYTGRRDLGASASNIFAGYVNYQLWDQESNKLPFFVGSYFGAKDVLNIGAGFFNHANGSVMLDGSGNLVGQNVNIIAADVFMEKGLDNGGAVTAYAQYQMNDFGQNYQLGGSSEEVFTGNIFYTQAGYVLPDFSDNYRLQPYATFTAKSIDAAGSANTVGVGANILLNGHNSKLTLEYKSTGKTDGTRGNMITAQAVIFL
ncbi:MAG: hypothetical protein RL754_79 [Bacteroidota bacterium]|jgi:hypothetical protein